MLAAGRHEPLVYGPDVYELPDGTDYTVIVDAADRLQWFGAPTWDPNQVFNHWDVADPCWVISNQRAAAAIRERWQHGDVLGVIAGTCQAPLVAALADLRPLVWEWGIGYTGVLKSSHKVFESYAWAHHVAGLSGRDDIAYYDTVIPNCYDPADFTPSTRAGDYLLFMGRPTERKGLPIVRAIAERVDLPLKVAGQPGHNIPGAEYLGVVTGNEKAELLAGARALLCPTTYLEPFGGVAVEAMLSGTPVISTDWGAFTETVTHGVTGYRARTLRQFLDGVRNAESLDRHQIVADAHSRFTTAIGAWLYSQQLDVLADLYGEGWYAHSPKGKPAA
jgi:glycosyltransferase involved in cell wall biosynthesis